MPVDQLDHINIRTTKLREMVSWYTDVLGLSSGWRPSFPFDGAWMYANEKAIVHLVEIADPPAVGAEVDLKLEHFALKATDISAFEANLKALGLDFRKTALPETKEVAFNIWDPDGNHIHVDFQDAV